MNVKTAIKLALAAAATLPAASWALTPAAVNALPAANIIYVSGSTATDAALQAWAKLNPSVDPNAPFQAGTYDLYKTATGYVLTGKASGIFAAHGVAAGTSIAFVKQTQGGSATGVHNVNVGLSTPGFSDILNASFPGSCAAAVPTGAASPFQAFNTYTCSQAEISVVPNAGISDEDPTSFIGTGSVSAADASALNAKNGVQVPFGVIVSTAMRNALQTAEGLASGSETLANVPSMTSTQLRAIFAGGITSWDDVFVLNAASGNMVAVDPGQTGSFVHVCRRGDTSGTMFATNINFFQKGCSKGTTGGVAAADAPPTQLNGETWTGGTGANDLGLVQLGMAFFAGSGTGDVKNCVSAGLDTPPADPAGVDTVNFRIGFVSMDQAPTLASTWRYVAIDGVAPTIWNIQRGSYQWLTEDTFNSTAASLARNGSTLASGIFTTVAANFADLNALAGLNAATQNAVALADTSNGGADTGLVQLGSTTLWNAAVPWTAGPSVSAGWPAAIRAINVAGKGPLSSVSKTYGGSVNNCNYPFQVNPAG
ncbi:MAG TPA: substrate-binding domain-containing protein [Steroidobacteraceae bacterium]|jgi:ABC-type phosphate transport system substrate-binding protein